MSNEFDPFAGPVFEKSAPSTESQREVFAATKWGPEASCAYNESGSLILQGDLDVSALKQALTQLTNRHDSLRMFFSEDGQTLFVRPNGVAPEFNQVDLSGLSESDRDARLAALLARDVESPFDLENGPLFRSTLARTGRDTHQLVMTGHHIVVDGWSWGVLLRELGPLYTAALGDSEAGLESASSFVDYAAQERAAESTEGYAQAQRYWLSQFSGASLPELDLPTDHRRPAFKTYASQRIDFPIPRALSDRLKSAGAKLGASYFVTMLAGFSATLHRLTRQEDLVVGIPVAGQAATGAQNLIGHCANLLPLRIGVPEEMTFSELVKSVRKVLLDGSEHQHLSFGGLLKQLAVKRDPSRLPLASVVFNIDQASDGKDLGFAGLDVRYFTNPRHFENFELFVNATEVNGETVVEVQYNTDMFDNETVVRWFSSMQTLLESAASAPDTRIGSLNLLGVAERDKILKDWNATVRDYKLNTTVHELFEAQVERTPDAVALQFGMTKLTYRDLDARSNQLARHLRGLGVAPDRLVAIYVERSIEMVVGMIAVHKAGGAYVPLDPNYPQERVSFIQKDAGAVILLTQASLATRLSLEASVTVIELDTDWPEIERVSSERLERITTAQHLSHVIYTSGSTGQPKGVAVEHKNTVNFCHWAAEAFTDAQRDGVLFSTSICFDLSVFELFATLSWGGRVVLVEDALALATLPPGADVRLVNSVPSVLATVLKTVALPASVQTVNLAGEPLKDDLVRQLYNSPSIKDVFDLYGPSETTTYSTYTRRVAGARPTIGRPLANTLVYVLDSNLQLLPQGVPGELFIGGAGVARGYLGRAELTAERFLKDPYTSELGARMYRTGDLVRWLPDGTLEYLGRIDHQVKIRGFRVELGEIESVVLTHGSVREATVIAREDIPGDVRIVAYLVPREGEDYSDTGLRKLLRKSLPDYMIPQHFVELNKLPLTPNGKVDRKALPAPAGSASSARALVSPRTDAERMLAQLFQETLKISGISVHDNFFDLGGHSLLCFQVIAKVQEKTGVRLNPRIMLMNTLEQTAVMLVQEQESLAARAYPEQAEAVASTASAETGSFAQKLLRKLGLN